MNQLNERGIGMDSCKKATTKGLILVKDMNKYVLGYWVLVIGEGLMLGTIFSMMLFPQLIHDIVARGLFAGTMLLWSIGKTLTYTSVHEDILVDDENNSIHEEEFEAIIEEQMQRKTADAEKA